MTTKTRRLARRFEGVPRRSLAALAAAAFVLAGGAVALTTPTGDAGGRADRAAVSQTAGSGDEVRDEAAGVNASGAGPGVVSASGAKTSDAVAGGDRSAAPPGTLPPGPIPPAPVPPGSVVPGQPRIVKNAHVRVKVAEGSYRSAFDRASAIAGAAGGFVVSSTTSTEDDVASGELVLRIPSERFDAVRRDLAGLGEVENEQLSGEDVSGQLVDLAARIRSLQVQEEALRSLLGRADTVGEVLEVQTQLGNVRMQIEQLQAQQSRLEDAAGLATIRVSLFEPGAGALRPEEPKGTLARSLERAVDASLAVLGGMVVVAGYVLPVVVLTLLAWGASRLRRRPAAA